MWNANFYSACDLICEFYLLTTYFQGNVNCKTATTTTTTTANKQNKIWIEMWKYDGHGQMWHQNAFIKMLSHLWHFLYFSSLTWIKNHWFCQGLYSDK